MSLALLIDFGSTYTKLRALDLAGGHVVGTAQGPSTVATDVNIGLDAALAALSRAMGGLPRFAHRLASSSAAGGLRMVTVGLVRELTAEAARQAALGAGARLVASFAYRLTSGDVARIVADAPDILLLCGGTDGGNSAVVLHNARALAGSALQCTVVVACNREATDDVWRCSPMPASRRSPPPTCCPGSTCSTSSPHAARSATCSCAASSPRRGSTARAHVSTRC